MNKKLILGFVILAVIVVVFSIWFVGQVPPKESELPPPSTVPVTPGYIRGYDHKLGYGFEYPEDWEMQIPEYESPYEKVVELLGQNNDFRESQKTQNPQAVFLSTSPIPVASRFPGLLGIPNSAFVVRLSFSKQVTESEVDSIKGNNFKITRNYLANASAQIKYPLQEAIKHISEGAFSQTKTLIIETPDIVTSEQIAEHLSSLKLVKEWIEKKGGQIIVAEVKSGKTKNIYTYKSNI